MQNLAALALVALGYVIVGVSANSGYAGSCTNIQIYPPDGNTNYWKIAADCKNNAGQTNLNTKININSCFSNSNGALVAQLNGAWASSCTNVILTGTVLSASCRNQGGASVNTSIDTNNVIGNADGALYCFNQGNL
ncbi:Cyanovirin-N [Trichoderma sp. SZMC 28013]